MSEKHSPLPWRLEPTSWVQHENGTKAPFCTIESEARGDIAYLTLLPNEVQANAALIVRSVNAMPALVKALDGIVNAWDRFEEEELQLNEGVEQAIAAARAALATVRGDK